MDSNFSIKMLQQEEQDGLPVVTLFDSEHSNIMIDQDIISVLEAQLSDYLGEFGEVSYCSYNLEYGVFFISIRVYEKKEDIIPESEAPTRELPEKVLACLGLSRQTPVFKVYFSEMHDRYSNAAIPTDPSSIVYEFTFFPPNLVSLPPVGPKQLLLTSESESMSTIIVPFGVKSLFFDKSFRSPIHFVGILLEPCSCDSLHIDVSGCQLIEILMITELYDQPIKGLEILHTLQILHFDDTTRVYPDAMDIMSLTSLTHLEIGYLFCGTLTFDRPVNVRFCGVNMCNPDGTYHMLLNLYADYPSRFFTTEPPSICQVLEISDFNKVLQTETLTGHVPLLSRIEIVNPSLQDAMEGWIEYARKYELPHEFVMDILDTMSRHVRIDLDRLVEQYLKKSYATNVKALTSSNLQSRRLLDLPSFYNEHDGLLSYVYSRV